MKSILRKPWVLGLVGGLILVFAATAPTEELYGNYNFLLEISSATGDKTIIGGFKSVSGMDSETEVVEYREGGENSRIHKLPGPTRYGNIMLRKGVADEPFPDSLWEWYEGITEGSADPRSASLVLMRNAKDEVLRYNFFEAWPCKWKGFTLDGKGSDVVVEEVELCVEGVERVAK